MDLKPVPDADLGTAKKRKSLTPNSGFQHRLPRTGQWRTDGKVAMVLHIMGYLILSSNLQSFSIKKCEDL
jgi:hypothetical protein